MIDTLIIVCHLVVNIATTAPSSQNVCAFQRHKIAFEVASKEAKANAIAKNKEQIEKLTNCNELLGEIQRIFHEARLQNEKPRSRKGANK